MEIDLWGLDNIIKKPKLLIFTTSFHFTTKAFGNPGAFVFFNRYLGSAEYVTTPFLYIGDSGDKRNILVNDGFSTLSSIGSAFWQYLESGNTVLSRPI